jgi:hypothetical protein
VPRELVKGVRERIDLFGDEAIPLYEEDARGAIEGLAAAGVEAIVVNLLFSYRNSSHEDRIREIVAELAPHVPLFWHCRHRIAGFFPPHPTHAPVPRHHVHMTWISSTSQRSPVRFSTRRLRPAGPLHPAGRRRQMEPYGIVRCRS